MSKFRSTDGHAIFNRMLGALVVACDSIEVIASCAPSATIVGGAVRDFYMGSAGLSADIDLVVDDSEFDSLNHLLARFSAVRNRHGNWRLRGSGGVQIDIWSPGRFFDGFSCVSTMLEHFDCTVNAIGVRVRDGLVFDPVGGLDDLRRGCVTLMEQRWLTSSEYEAAMLCLRLLRLLERHPRLQVLNSEVMLAVVSSLENVPGSVVFEEVGISPERAMSQLREMFSDVVAMRPQPSLG